ncbi:hypothetical protein DERF_006295 [Dermatophagoides farinae]|uniref:CCHC-type domain-containing protein n=1 Tax=Dermatophagoides farinae TaxID=6954 RepID=A0A922I7I1_DERFA|nr:hypothetical protein DERF_006295 [Dermatophagoides farinae]
MSENEGPVVTDSAGTIQDDMMDGDNKQYSRYNDRRGGGGGGGFSRNNGSRCYNCGQFGHLSYDCRKPQMSGGGGGGGGNGMMSFRSRNNQQKLLM